ncbi:MAG: UDP-N-acetylmuramate--alanine ligase [Candidatus Rokuibacteriota bacterium]|nr:MAG: UDP-N-acetylmuramate--alanine ligase [Candidatus Rokubacteria bacterium]
MRYHFSGVAGAGMNPLASLVRARGHDVQGSDRSFDQGKNREIAARLQGLGIQLAPHDGAAVTRAIDRFVYSAAVEADTPEMRAARALGLHCVSRPQLLAEVVNAGGPGIAVSGTSGKSTILGMVAWLLREGGVPATVLGGAALVGEGTGGCFIAGPAEGPVVAEACESDGTLAGYRPAIGLVHNVSRDHAELPALRPQFAAFAENCGRLLVNGACPEAAALGRRFKASTYGVSPGVDTRLWVTSVGPRRATGVLRVEGRSIVIDIPQPGLHNLENAAAAALIGLELGVDPFKIEALLARFPGVARRFEVVGTTASGIRVVDDYAHNGEKIRAAVTTAQASAPRVVVVFQPHGFGPARFLRPDLKDLLPRLLRPQDRFCYAEVFYAGGTVAKDISSHVLAGDLPERMHCGYARDHDAVRQWVLSEAHAGDTVLIMGARDPDLSRLAGKVFESLSVWASSTRSKAQSRL